MNKLKEKKLNNKGFSLVELIIVIAIMAVLVGVLAPQYLKYVERSRVSTDRDNIAAIESAIQVWGADPNATSSFADGDSITLSRPAAGATPPALPGAGTAIGDALVNAGITGNMGLTNRQTFSQVVITVHINTTTGVITVTPVETAG